jgi:hypothetical protein
MIEKKKGEIMQLKELITSVFCNECWNKTGIICGSSDNEGEEGNGITSIDRTAQIFTIGFKKPLFFLE